MSTITVQVKIPGWRAVEINAVRDFESAVLEAVAIARRARADTWIFRMAGGYVATCNPIHVHYFGINPHAVAVDVVDA